MRSFFLSIGFVLMAAVAGAQQLHFVYLQTDSRKPFYVLLNNKNYSSSSIGYVILPKLQNGDYALRLGFPKSEQPEQEFLVQVKNNDQGFLIKDFGDKGWGLFNLQSLDIQYAGALAEKRNQQLAQQKAEEEKQQQEAAAVAQRKTDSLQAVALAQKQAQADSEAAQTAIRQQRYNDSVQQATTAATNLAADQKAQHEAAQRRTSDSLQKASEAATSTSTNQKAQEEAEQRRITDSLQNAANIAAEQRAQQEAAQRSRTVDSLNKIQATTLENERSEKLADSTAKAQAATIEKAKQSATGMVQTGSPVLLQKTFTDSGWRYSYSVNSGAGKETVDVFIPVRQPQVAIVAAPVVKDPVVQAEIPAATTQPVTTQPEPVNPASIETKKVDPNFLDISFGSNGTTVVKTDSTGVKVLHNSNCRTMADDKDFLSTRKKIIASDDTEKMIATARKMMKEKCYSTAQIRNLSFLFLTDADRYQFLDAAYPFAVDAYRFNSLQDLLKEDYYIQRFKAMLR